MIWLVFLFIVQSEHDITNEYNDSNGGLSLGNGCGSEYSKWVYNGNLRLNKTIELNNASLKIKGRLITEGGVILKRCENDTIIQIR